MSQWVIKGIQTGIKTTAYPNGAENAAGVTPGLPCGGKFTVKTAEELVKRCPVEAFHQSNGELTVDYHRCVHCYQCVRGVEHPVNWKNGYEWAVDNHTTKKQHLPGAEFKRSVNIIVVDVGDCGACLNEVKQLNNPYYNMHRLGFFITPTPRHADILLVVGPVTDHLRVMLKKVYDAMPTPKRVVAVGACALSGGVFKDSFVCAKGVADILPVDIMVPGNPPPPLAILHGLLLAVGRKPSSNISSTSAVGQRQ